jgi:nuclear pore complex protein Nup205
MSASGNVKVPLVSNLPVWHQQQAFKKIGESFDQTNAFVILVNALLTPSLDQVDDGMLLSFPANLGGSYRMPGVGPYIDFILGHAFSRKVQDLNDHQSRLLTYNCLEFVVASLKSFNENLVLAFSEPSGSNASLVSTYVVSHPFARVVEWLFNEDVLKSLFAAAQQDTTEVCMASSDSVVVLTLLRSLEAMAMLLDLQSTYLNVVKPIVASQLAAHRTNVANSSLSSFEDSVLSNLSLIPLLCLYCSTGHLDLAITSMQLLERFSSSRKLNKMSLDRSSNKIVEVLSSELDVDSVSKPLVFHMTPDIREFDYGPEAASYVIRENILALLRQCLGSITDCPTVAHLLLGFKCVGSNLEISSEGLFAEQGSLLHAIVDFLKDYPEHLDGSIVSWAVTLKRLALEVLKHLWSSKLASFETLGAMRSMNLLQVMFAKQPIIDSNTLWSGFRADMDDFLVSDGATAMREFLYYRSFLFAYAAAEVRSTAKTGSQALYSQTMAVLLGNTVMENDQPLQGRSVFDLFDFADLGVLRVIEKPPLFLLDEISAQVKYDAKEGKLDEYNVKEFQALVRVRDAELSIAGEKQRFRAEAHVFEQFIHARNHRSQILSCHYAAFKAWTELISTMIACSNDDEGVSPAFILLCLQLILPQLEAATDDGLPWALELARLAEILISCSGDEINDKLYHLFQICIQGINLATGDVLLRETYYMICSHYVTRITSFDTNKRLRMESQRVITKCCPVLVENICDDALNGQDSCRASALLLLNGLAILDSQTDCVLAKHISELSLFLDSLRALPIELSKAQKHGKTFFPPSVVASLLTVTFRY